MEAVKIRYQHAIHRNAKGYTLETLDKVTSKRLVCNFILEQGQPLDDKVRVLMHNHERVMAYWK